MARHASRQNALRFAGGVGLARFVAALAIWLSRRRQSISLWPVRVGVADRLMLVTDEAPLVLPSTGAESDALRAGFAAHLA
ncbi:MAG TPA: hypothetical protein VI136_26805 [Verrucomicrobiae bacterium]